ncbi:MAG: biotin--[acetyl-CoA-carboxylase] ligase [Candidatus Rokubacteria bacterium]|nr:biotin--[acetyl-CoA-carboxylase] ligase [Candidatus Rokubacteria bacterium]
MTTESAVVGTGLGIEAIRRKLSSETVGRQIYLFGGVSSTSGVLRGLAKAGAREGTVVLAEAQTEGRGRGGQPWFSPPGLNLYASVLFRPSIPLKAVPVFSFIASLALTEAIWGEGLRAAIKWPNDVLVERKKVAGSLVECASAGGQVEYVILGVGVNLNVRREALRAALGDAAHAATSLREVARREIDRNAFAATFLALLDRWCRVYATRGPEAVLAAWRDRDILTGRRVEIRGDGERYEGRALGVNRDGRLVIEDIRGMPHQVVAGEVRLLD